MKFLLILTLYSSQLIDYYNGDIKPADDEAREIVAATIQNPPNDYEHCLALYLSGYLHKKNEDYTAASIDYSKAIKILTEGVDTTDYYLEISLRNNIGSIMDDLHNYSQALRFYEAALPFAEKYNQNQVARIYENMANTYLMQRDKKFIEYYFKALDIHQELGNAKSTARTYNRLGYALYRTELYDTASYYLMKAKGVNDKYNGPANFYAGMCAQKQKRYQDADDLFNQAIIAFKNTESNKWMLRTYTEKIKLQLEQETIKDLDLLFAEGLTYYNRLDIRTDEHEIKKLYKQYLLKIGDMAGYVAASEEYDEIMENNATERKQSMELANQSLIMFVFDAVAEREKKEVWPYYLMIFGLLTAVVLLGMWMRSRLKLRTIEKRNKHKFAMISQLAEQAIYHKK